ncbi:hypothetical protein [Nonomuraea sp. NPDC050202]|uniref:hypothetical protein n=1 Tax=Nonomuraea sp. NPDC050202 TaxID=3155035 RepID=UPI0033DB1647
MTPPIAEMSPDRQRSYVRTGTHILVCKMMLATGLTEGEIARAVIEAASFDGALGGEAL